VAVGAPYLQAEWKDMSRKKSSFLDNEIHIRIMYTPQEFSRKLLEMLSEKLRIILTFRKKHLKVRRLADTSSVHEVMQCTSPFLLVTHLHPQTSFFTPRSLVRTSSFNTLTKK